MTRVSGKKLTKAGREALEWFVKNGPASLFGVNDPSSTIRKRLLAAWSHFMKDTSRADCTLNFKLEALP